LLQNNFCSVLSKNQRSLTTDCRFREWLFRLLDYHSSGSRGGSGLSLPPPFLVFFIYIFRVEGREFFFLQSCSPITFGPPLFHKSYIYACYHVSDVENEKSFLTKSFIEQTIFVCCVLFKYKNKIYIRGVAEKF